MYNYRYINPLYQFGVTSYTLILEDLDNPDNPVFRIDKSFSVDPSLIDDDFLYQQARQDVINASQYDPTNVPTPDKNISALLASDPNGLNPPDPNQGD